MNNSLFLEFLFYVLFLYFSVTTFCAEFFNGFLQSFLCIFGWVSLKESTADGLNLQPFYYTYLIIISLVGNVVFVISLLVYGPVCRIDKARRQSAGAVLPGAHGNRHSRHYLYFWRRPMSHICVFTRYDLYGSLVLVFIATQIVLQRMAAVDDFKAIEGSVFAKTIIKYKTNATDCWSDLCDDLTGHQALKGIHDFQYNQRCCGWSGAEDWLSATGARNKSNDTSLPMSCCDNYAVNCSLDRSTRFPIGCHEFEIPVRGVIDPIRYSDRCFGAYPLFKLFAVISYQFSFKRLFNGNAVLLTTDISLPTSARFL
jgi:hypothetical protein